MIDHAVVIAVGNAAHQSKLVYNRPRTMLPALGKPLVVRVMDRLLRAGINRYTVIVGEKEGAIAAYLDSQWVASASVELVVRSSKHTLAQSLSEVARQQGHRPFLLASYNSFTHINFAERLSRRFANAPDTPLFLSGAEASLSRSDHARYISAVDSHVTDLSTLPSEGAYIHTDLAACGAAFSNYLETLPMTEDGLLCNDLVSVYERYLRSGGAASLVPTSWSLKIEQDRDLLTLNRHLLDEEQDAHILSEIPANVQVLPPVRIDPSVSIGQNARIGPYAYLESGCSIGDGAVISNAMILNKVTIRAGESVADSIVATRARIHA